MAGDTIIELEPNTIGQGNRIGLFWADKAKAMGALMKRDGQNDPIKVRKGRKGEEPWVLVAGLHRLVGAMLEGLKVKAIVVEGDALQLRLVEASENMHRRDFGPIEKALFVRALADVYEEQFRKGYGDASDQEIGQRKRWEAERGLVQNGAEKLAEIEADNSAATIAALYGWQDQAASALGMSPRSLRDYLFIHRAIIVPLPDHYEDLARHPIGERRKTVMELAEIGDVENRRAVIDCLLEYPAGLTIAAAKEIVGIKAAAAKGKATGQSKFMDNAGSNLDRLSESGWRQFAPRLAAAIKPSALREVRDAIDARLAEIEGDNA
ncbi:ParB N-terminal domain-containing protein [Blastomonas fulva]|uniref:ParB N-terminal domain-containing protein n=1 Tax=Blastomonas fulva TaxID=1550728 RepID=UPI0025A3ECAC|nr:ParB N-terminal domain-containing protein [Blastomonas fulva]MDM7928699.1 ParB N-terminal domain-containing protein [Blastomonas fulva]MDM7964485.1 ParB N-terminal domain-containing protein [Blastomonas fulva]